MCPTYIISAVAYFPIQLSKSHIFVIFHFPFSIRGQNNSLPSPKSSGQDFLSMPHRKALFQVLPFCLPSNCGSHHLFFCLSSFKWARNDNERFFGVGSRRILCLRSRFSSYLCLAFFFLCPSSQPSLFTWWTGFRGLKALWLSSRFSLPHKNACLAPFDVWSFG